MIILNRNDISNVVFTNFILFSFSIKIFSSLENVVHIHIVNVLNK